MNARGIIPLIDLSFLTLGAVVALLALSEYLERMPMDLADGPGVGRVEAPPDHVPVTVAGDVVYLDEVPVELGLLASEVGDRVPVVRPAAGIEAERLLEVLATLAPTHPSVQLEYEPAPGPPISP